MKDVVIGVIAFVCGIVLPSVLSPIGDYLKSAIWGDVVQVYSVGECQFRPTHPACQGKKPEFQVPRTYLLKAGDYRGCVWAEPFNYLFQTVEIVGLPDVPKAGSGPAGYCIKEEKAFFCSSALVETFSVPDTTEIMTTSTYPGKQTLYRVGLLQSEDKFIEACNEQ